MATAAVTNTFVAATAAEAAEVNTNFTDLVTFLNNSVVHRDGSKAMTGNFDAGSNKIVNLTDGTADSDAVNFGQLKEISDGAGNISATNLKVYRAVGVATGSTGVLTNQVIAHPLGALAPGKVIGVFCSYEGTSGENIPQPGTGLYNNTIDGANVYVTLPGATYYSLTILYCDTPVWP